MTKSTHRGTCQVCGQLQCLPKGTLAKHGYNVKWGFFSGTCWGTGRRPFEQAFDAVQEAIGWAVKHKQDLEQQVAKLATEPIGDIAPFHRYFGRKSTSRLVGYYEVTVTIIPSGEDYFAILFDDNTVEPCSRYCLNGSKEKIIRALRASRIERLQVGIAERARYIAWQQHRVDTWKPGELTEIK